MGELTGINWTDHTFNPWWGCSRVSPGCDHCYAESLDKRWYPVRIERPGMKPMVAAKHWGNGNPRRTFGQEHWNEPLKWVAGRAASGAPRPASRGVWVMQR